MRNLFLWENSKGNRDLHDTSTTINLPLNARCVRQFQGGIVMTAGVIFVKTISNDIRTIIFVWKPDGSWRLVLLKYLLRTYYHVAASCRLNLGSHLSNRSPSNSGKVADDLPMVWISIVRPAMQDLGAGGGIRTHESLRNRVIGKRAAYFAGSF